MSVEVMAWVLHHSPTSGTEKVLLLGLANHAAPDGSNAWPSLATLSTYARVDRRSVRRALRRLEEAGAIVVEPAAGGLHDTPPERRTNRYRIVMGEGVETSPRRGGLGVPPQGVETSGGEGVETSGGEGVETSPETSIEPSTETSIEPSPLNPPAPLADRAEALRLRLWSVWPPGRRVGLPATRRAIAAALRAGHDPGDILAGAQRDAGVWSGWPEADRRFIPHPATWVNDQRWLSDPPPSDRRRRSRRDEQVDDLSALASGAAALPSFDDLLGGFSPDGVPELDDPGSMGA